nr:hypothetical protein [Neobacillus sp. Marseille-Q6967]
MTVNVFSKLAPMVIELAFTFGTMAGDVHTQRIALFLATLKSRFFTGRSEVLPYLVIFAIVASNHLNGKAIDRNTVRNAESLPRRKTDVKGTSNIRKENDGLRTKMRVLSVQLAYFSGFKSKVMQ